MSMKTIPPYRGRHTYAKVPQRRLALSCELEFSNIRFDSFDVNVCASIHCRALVVFACVCIRQDESYLPENFKQARRKQILYSKTLVNKGIPIFLIFLFKTKIVGTR